jgi:nucleotide-binding universal stress UspA family protein
MTGRLHTIVAGVATREACDPALAASIHLARRTGAALHLVHAYLATEESLDWNLETWMGGTSRPCAQARLLESQMQTQVDAIDADLPVECIALPGGAGEVLPAYATVVGGDLLVLAPTRHAGAPGVVLGTTASRVLRASSVPVLVAREPLAEQAARRVLLPTDLSEHSARALPLAVELAGALAGGQPPMLLPLFVSPSEVEVGLVIDQVEQAQAELDAFLASIPAVAVPGVVRVGNPAHAILRVARSWGADLVVLGTHGRRGMPRLFLGSVAETVLRKAPCSALVIPPATVRSSRTKQAGWTAEPPRGDGRGPVDEWRATGVGDMPAATYLVPSP